MRTISVLLTKHILIIFFIAAHFGCDNPAHNVENEEIDKRWTSYSVDCDQVRFYLENAFDRDQGIRQGTFEGSMESIDHANQELLLSILQCCGHDAIAKAGDKASRSAFFIAQHAPPSFREDLFPIFEHWANEGIIAVTSLTLMIDRIFSDNDQPQLYGTQVVSNEEGNMVLYKVDDINQVIKRRDSLGMEPLKDYLARFDVYLDSLDNSN